MPYPLYMVSTPIGNLKDITIRALDILTSVSLIACEDTRRTLILLNHYNIKNKLLSYNDKNKMKISPKIISHLDSIGSVALVSDSGTPSISDPGVYIVRRCIEKDIQVIPVPGPSSLLSALVPSGAATDNFIFIGFLPRKKTKRKKKIETVLNFGITAIIFESPQRIVKTLQDISSLAPERDLVIGRELTKIHEDFVFGNVEDLLCVFTEKKPKGEFVLIIKEEKK